MISSLRLGSGRLVSATDGRGKVYDLVIEEAKRHRVKARVLDVRKIEAPCPEIFVFQGVVKPSNMELIVEKCVELGISGFVPVMCERCVARLGGKRTARLERIAIEAMKQSLGAYLPALYPAMAFGDALAMLGEFGSVLVAWGEELACSLADAYGREPAGSLALWIGPEGGLTKSEVDSLTGQGARTFSLGDHRLKSETAAIASVAIIQALQTHA
jgi:16S rRNA (uracil1498-N3)-methyltransferase